MLLKFFLLFFKVQNQYFLKVMERLTTYLKCMHLFTHTPRFHYAKVFLFFMACDCIAPHYLFQGSGTIRKHYSYSCCPCLWSVMAHSSEVQMVLNEYTNTIKYTFSLIC